MPEKPASERTEQPTPHRLRKAREQGRVPTSSEVPSALMIAALLVVLALTAPVLLRWMTAEVRGGMSCAIDESAGPEALAARLGARAGRALLMLVPFMLAGGAVAVLSGLLVGGWTCAPGLASPNFERISPVQGLKNLLGLRSLMHLLAAVLKLLLVLTIVYFYLRGRLGQCASLKWASPGQILLAIGRLVFGLGWRVAVGLLAIGIGDALFQRWKHRRDLRMSRQELKEEIKEHELSPQVRSRIRSIRLTLARKRMLKEVPSADVVVTNPTHVAVALKYEPGAMDAPEVVAKGADLLAEKIRQIAEAHNVPLVRRPELARTLYETVEVGASVPEALFVAVAEVLAMIYRLRKKRLDVGASAGGRES